MPPCLLPSPLLRLLRPSVCRVIERAKRAVAGLAWRGVAWRGVARRGAAWRGMARACPSGAAIMTRD